jgi:hypothetical protein
MEGLAVAEHTNWGLDARRVGAVVHATVDMERSGNLSAFHRALGHKFELGDQITVWTKSKGIYPRRRLVLQIIDVENRPRPDHGT